MLQYSMLLPISHLLSGFQTVISCTEDTARQTLFFFAEFHFTRILQDAGKTTCGSAQEKGLLDVLLYLHFQLQSIYHVWTDKTCE